MAEEHCTRLCSVDTCERASRVRGMCSMHWNRWRKHGDPEIRSPAQLAGMTCTVDWCERPARSRWAGDGPYCARHYHQLNQTGRIKPKGNDPLDGRLCSIDGCTRVARSRTAEWCEVHYYRNRRKGSPLAEVIQKGGHESCVYCGEATTGRKYCTTACAARYLRGNPLSKECAICGARFDPRSLHGRDASVCSDECARIRAREHDDIRRFASGLTPEGRRVRYSVMKRDGWVCQLCGDATDRSVMWPHPLYPTIDHIVPVSKGGTHDMSNLQCAHARCNIRKQAMLPHEYALRMR